MKAIMNVMVCEFLRTEQANEEIGIIVNETIIIDKDNKVVAKVWNYKSKPYDGTMVVYDKEPPCDCTISFDIKDSNTTRQVCSDCGRPKARNANDCMAGDCSKWYAIRDSEAFDDCDLYIKESNNNG